MAQALPKQVYSLWDTFQEANRSILMQRTFWKFLLSEKDRGVLHKHPTTQQADAHNATPYLQFVIHTPTAWGVPFSHLPGTSKFFWLIALLHKVRSFEDVESHADNSLSGKKRG